MELEATPGALHIRFHSRFTVPEAKHLREALVDLAPIERLTLDFSGARELQDSAIPILADALNALPHTRILIRGLTMNQWKLLRRFGVEAPAAAI